MVRVNAKERELQSLPDVYPHLPSFDLPLWDSTSAVLGQAQGQHSEEDVEGVGRAVELGVSRGVEGRGGAAAAGLVQQSQGRLAQRAHARHAEPGYGERSTLGGQNRMYDPTVQAVTIP